MNSDFIKLTGNEDRHKISDRFEFWSYLTSHFGVTCSSAVKKMMSPAFSQSPLIGSLSNLQVMRTGIKAQTSSNLGGIGLFTLELFALEHRFLIFNPRGYIHVLNHEHSCIKADFKEISLKGHLCLWREDSLKEKYNTKYFKIIFYLIFRVYK